MTSTISEQTITTTITGAEGISTHIIGSNAITTVISSVGPVGPMGVTTWSGLTGVPSSFTPSIHGNEAHSEEYATISGLNEFAKKSNVLELDNITVFTPDGEYEPATKKYVDDNSGGIPSNTVSNETSFGITPDAGDATTYARGDHTHGSQPYPIGGVDKNIQFNDNGVHGGDGSLLWDKSNQAVKIGTDVVLLPNNPLAIEKSVDSYLQLNIKNDNGGENASSDYIVTADNGSDTGNYGDLGICNSGYDVPEWDAVLPDDTYVFGDGGNVAIATLTVGKTIPFFVAQTDHEIHPEDKVGHFDLNGLDIPTGKDVTIDDLALLKYGIEIQGTGLVSGGNISFVSDVTVSVASGIGYISNNIDSLARVSWGNKLIVPMLFDGINIINIDDNGSVVILAESDTTGQYIEIGAVLTGSLNTQIIEIVNSPIYCGKFSDRVNMLISSAIRAIVEPGASTVTSSGLAFSIAAGNIHSQLGVYSVDSRTAFTGLMNTADYGWVPVSANVVDPTQWNDVTQNYGAQSITLTSGYWKKDLILRVINGDVFYIFGQGEYATEDLAKAAPIPNVPTSVGAVSIFLCTIVSQKSDTDIGTRLYDIRPDLARIFGYGTASSGATVLHSALAGLGADDHTQYLTTTRANTWLGTKTTDNITEGTAKYYTAEKAQDDVGGMATGSLVYVDATPSLALDGDEISPSVSKYYGTNALGDKGFHALPISPEPGASKSFAIAMACALG